jgi:hypothetical protein
MARNGPTASIWPCPFIGVDQKSDFDAARTVVDPKATSRTRLKFMPMADPRGQREILQENFVQPTKNADLPAHYIAYLAWLRVRQQDW